MKRRRHRGRRRQAAKQARIGPGKYLRATEGLLAPLRLVAVVTAGTIRVLVVARTRSSRRSLRVRMPFALPIESVRMAAMVSAAIPSGAPKKCQQRLGPACVLLVFAKRLSLESVSVPRERKTTAEGATTNNAAYPISGSGHGCAYGRVPFSGDAVMAEKAIENN